MTDAEIVRTAAERVMNWRVHFRNTAWWVPVAEEKGIAEHIMAIVREWNPLTSDDHAFMLVDKSLGKVDIKRERNRHWVCIIDGGDVVVSKDRRRCIVLACLKAVGVYA